VSVTWSRVLVLQTSARSALFFSLDTLSLFLEIFAASSSVLSHVRERPTDGIGAAMRLPSTGRRRESYTLTAARR
jgi:hypothetical protein